MTETLTIEQLVLDELRAAFTRVAEHIGNDSSLDPNSVLGAPFALFMAERAVCKAFRQFAEIEKESANTREILTRLAALEGEFAHKRVDLLGWRREFGLVDGVLCELDVPENSLARYTVREHAALDHGLHEAQARLRRAKQAPERLRCDIVDHRVQPFVVPGRRAVRPGVPLSCLYVTAQTQTARCLGLCRAATGRPAVEGDARDMARRNQGAGATAGELWLPGGWGVRRETREGGVCG